MTEHHRARRLALQGLYCLDVQGEAGMEAVPDFLRDGPDNPATVAEAEHVIRSVFARRAEIDDLLASKSPHWEVARMAIVDRNILRLAVWELLTGHAPKKVVINEALLLAKEFASVESSRFINGVLDAAARKVLEKNSRDTEIEDSSQ